MPFSRAFFVLALVLGLLAAPLRAGTPCNPHGDWGARISLQDPFIICSINSFLQDKGPQFGLPAGMAVTPHPNGYSLTYHWTDADGTLVELHQTARPSVWFAAISLNGVTINAQERGWGFVTGFRGFGRKPVHERAEITLHEFIHQFLQIREMGGFRYWTSYTAQFLTRGYSRITFEKEAHAVSKAYYRHLSELCGMRLNSAGLPARTQQPEQSVPSAQPMPALLPGAAFVGRGGCRR